MTNRPVCALTGSGGYLGSRLKTHLVANGWDVLELTRAPRSGTNAVAFRLGEKVAPETLADVQCIVHCAYDFEARTWNDIHRINVEGTRLLFNAAANAGVERIVCISTISAFARARSLYGKAKFAIEQDALARGAFVVRPGLIYDDQPGGMFGSLVASVRGSHVVPLIGDGTQKQYLVHGDDLAAVIVRAARGEVSIASSPIAAAHPKAWELRAILDAIATRLDRKVTFVPIPWRIVWSGIKLAEVLGVPTGFRSDSVVSLIHQDPSPRFSLDFAFRAFDVRAVALDTVSA